MRQSSTASIIAGCSSLIMLGFKECAATGSVADMMVMTRITTKVTMMEICITRFMGMGIYESVRGMSDGGGCCMVEGGGRIVNACA